LKWHSSVHAQAANRGKVVKFLIYSIVIGVGATAMVDVWSVVRHAWFRIAAPDYGLVGRWLAHMTHGRFRHEAIAKTALMPGERFIGWSAHYLIGVAFAAVLLSIYGIAWIQHPTIAPALVVGIGTVIAPFLLMQPAMGAGIAARRTARPGAARLQSLITHTIFGVGLYAAGWVANYFLNLGD
jgi:Protein of unknown function (DUF2938)